VVAIRRTIGQAQALGLQESDIIAAVNAVPVAPGVGIPGIKAIIGAATRPITLTLSRATKALTEKVTRGDGLCSASAVAEWTRAPFFKS